MMGYFASPRKGLIHINDWGVRVGILQPDVRYTGRCTFRPYSDKEGYFAKSANTLAPLRYYTFSRRYAKYPWAHRAGDEEALT
jgi:hypothetical protein